MLSRLGGRGYQVREGTGTYGQCEAEVDPDPDGDSDLDEKKPQPPVGDDGKSASQPCRRGVIRAGVGGVCPIVKAGLEGSGFGPAMNKLDAAFLRL